MEEDRLLLLNKICNFLEAWVMHGAGSIVTVSYMMYEGGGV